MNNTDYAIRDLERRYDIRDDDYHEAEFGHCNQCGEEITIADLEQAPPAGICSWCAEELANETTAYGPDPNTSSD